MYSFLRNWLTFEQQLFKKITFLFIPSSATDSVWLCLHQREGRVCPGHAAGVRQSSVGCWWYQTCSGVRVWQIPRLAQGWGHPKKDSGTSDAATRQAVWLARLTCRQMFSWPMLRLTFPSYPLPNLTLYPAACYCFFSDHALTAHDSRGTPKLDSGSSQNPHSACKCILSKLWQVKDNHFRLSPFPQALLEVHPCPHHPPKALAHNELPSMKTFAHILPEVYVSSSTIKRN